MECNCKDWEFAVPQINTAIVMWANRTYGSKYTGKPFKLCPWCGKNLEEKNEEEMEKTTK